MPGLPKRYHAVSLAPAYFPLERYGLETMERFSSARTFSVGRIVCSAHPCSHRFAARLRLGGYAGHHQGRATSEFHREELERRRDEQDRRLHRDGRGALRLLCSSRAPSCDIRIRECSSLRSSGNLTASPQVHLALTQPDRLRQQAHLPSASVWSRNALIAFLSESAERAEFAPVRRFLWFVEKSGLPSSLSLRGYRFPMGSDARQAAGTLGKIGLAISPSRRLSAVRQMLWQACRL